MAAKKKTKTKKTTARTTSSRKASAPKTLKKKTKKASTKKGASKKKAVSRKPAAKKKSSKKTTARKASRKAASKKTTKKAGSPKRASSRKGSRPADRSRAPSPPRREPAPKRRLSTFSDAVKIYEAAVRLTHKEEYEKARAEFDRLAAEYPNETELLDRANVLVQVCDTRLEEQKSSVGPKSGNDFYELGVAEMNAGELADAREHLEHALKLLPDADHVLYALAALHALRGEREAALECLARSIEARAENRFLAGNDTDFESLAEDPDFIRLLA